MSKGTIHPRESRIFRDPDSGVQIRQVTSHASIHHHPFFYIPPGDGAARRLIFVSHRSGVPAIFAEDRAEGSLVQLTDRSDVNEWSIHPSRDGRFVYFTAGSAAWRVGCEDFREECLASFGDLPILPPGMVGDAMGTTSLSGDDRWWAVPVKRDGTAQLHVIETGTGRVTVIAEAPVIGHPQFHPADPELLHFGGSFRERLWIVNRDGTGLRLLHRRDEARRQWLVHEVWHPQRRELLTIDWPHGMFAIDVDSGATRPVCRFNAWHPCPSPDGRRLVCDTTNPDRGLQLVDALDGRGSPILLCESQSSNQGSHWNTDHCPYDDGPVAVHAPQHTHPHPAFTLDGKYVIFTSDRTGHAQLYEVAVPAAS